jgi:lactate dehydrogenase-like 2-hydroxyacid dehydrogenase
MICPSKLSIKRAIGMNENPELKKVGIIGCGAIGTLIAEAAERKLVMCDELILYD